jgi:hypothetical protein
MWITVKSKRAVEIDAQLVDLILNIYPEEKLTERHVFKKAFIFGSIEFQDLKSESEKILIPWQFFLLDKKNLQAELNHIEKTRIDRVSAKLLAKRKGAGDVTSRRIIDRLIRLQNYLSDNAILSTNSFCGSLVGMKDANAVSHIISYFGIDMGKFWDYPHKADALKYLIEKIEDKYINVSRGVLANKILPNWRVVQNSLYKNTSGFVLKDEKIPFVFLPSEINPDETDGRQIYTLIYLIILIGLNQYDFILEKDFKVEVLVAKGQSAKIHMMISEFLLPRAVTNQFRGQRVTHQLRDDLSARHKLTPTAVLVTLKIRGHFASQQEYEALLPPEYTAPQTKGPKHSPKIETSVKKFCGRHPFNFINTAIKSGAVQSVQAQYLYIRIC